MKRLRITDPGQRKILGSPLRIELIEQLTRQGPASIAELAVRLGREPSSLYYHIRLLQRAGVVQEAERRGAGRHQEAVFAATADHVTVACDLDSEESIHAEEQSVGALLRLAQRQYGQAMRGGKARPEGDDSNLQALRIRANLDAKARTELNRRVEELMEFLRREREPGSGEPISLTLVISPLSP